MNQQPEVYQKCHKSTPKEYQLEAVLLCGLLFHWLNFIHIVKVTYQLIIYFISILQSDAVCLKVEIVKLMFTMLLTIDQVPEISIKGSFDDGEWRLCISKY